MKTLFILNVFCIICGAVKEYLNIYIYHDRIRIRLIQFVSAARAYTNQSQPSSRGPDENASMFISNPAGITDVAFSILNVLFVHSLCFICWQRLLESFCFVTFVKSSCTFRCTLNSTQKKQNDIKYVAKKALVRVFQGTAIRELITMTNRFRKLIQD